MSKFSYFVGAGDGATLFPHLDKLKPRGLKLLDNPELAIKAKKRYPTTTAIWRQNRQYRAHGGTKSNADGALHEVYPDPVTFLDERERILDALGWDHNIHIHLHNEAAWSKDVLDWQLAVAKEAVRRKIPLAVGGWAVGNPKIAQIPEAHGMLELLAEHPDLLILILNEYWAGAWVSGFIGADAPAGEDLYFTRYIPHEKWPTSLDGITPYHLGRYRHWLAYCDSKGLAHPRIHIGEFGPDAVSDGHVDGWRKGLLRVEANKEPRFYQTLAAQWKNWWPQWSLEEALFQQCKAAIEVVYDNPTIESVYYFTFGDSGGWGDANAEHARAFQAAMEAYSMSTVTTIFPAATDPRMKPALFKSTGTTTNLRERPSRDANSVLLFKEATGTFIPAGLLEHSERHVDQLEGGKLATWLPAYMVVDDKTYKGYVRDNAVLIQPLADSPAPIPPAEPPITLPPPDIATMLERFKAIAASADVNVSLLTTEVAELKEKMDAVAELYSVKNHMLTREMAMRDIALATVAEYSTEKKIA